MASTCQYGPRAVNDLPRLLLCCFDVVPAPTATSRRITEYVKGLTENYEVVILSVKTTESTHIERYADARLLRVPIGSGNLPERASAFDRAVRRQLESEEYSVVHFFEPFGGFALCERRAEFGYKLIYDACSLPSVDLPFLVDETEANRHFLAKVRRHELFCLLNADAVIVGNPLTRTHIIDKGVPAPRVHLLPAPVTLNATETPTQQQRATRLLHLGNYSRAHDLLTLLEAMPLALRSADVQLKLVGQKSPSQHAWLEAHISTLRLSGKVTLAPAVSHELVAQMVDSADIGLLTLRDVERNRSVGSAHSRLAEYLSAGLPVIAADVPSARALAPEKGTLFYRAEDAQSLADAIVSLSLDASRRSKLGAAARQGSAFHDASLIRAQLAQIYRALKDPLSPVKSETQPETSARLDRSLENSKVPTVTAPQSIPNESAPDFRLDAIGQITAPNAPLPPPGTSIGPLPPFTFLGLPPPQPTVPEFTMFDIPAATAPAALPPFTLTSEPPINVRAFDHHTQIVDAHTSLGLSVLELNTHSETVAHFEEINENEIEEIEEDDEAIALVEEESVMSVDSDTSPPPSAIDPWLAQLVYGYCPPQSGLFGRHTPPTTMPGRDSERTN